MTHSGETFLPSAFFCFRLISKKKHFFLSVQPKKHIKMEREKEKQARIYYNDKIFELLGRRKIYTINTYRFLLI